jgi:hypothetical protein
MSVLIKKFQGSPFRTPKLTYTSGDTEFTADYTEEWGPEFGKAVLAVRALAAELFCMDDEFISDIELSSIDWVTKDGRTKCRLTIDVILENRKGAVVGPCIMKSPWLNEEDLDGIADDAVKRMEALREACAEYVIGRQRAQMELFDYEDLGIVDVSSAGMLRQAQREGGE